MNKLKTTEEAPNHDELILIAHLARAFNRTPEQIIKSWNQGDILCWDWRGLIEYYEDFEDLLDGTIEETIAADIDRGMLVKIQSLYFQWA